MLKIKKTPMKYKNADGSMQDVGAIMGSEVTDITLSKSGVAADAKEVGNRLGNLSQDIADLDIPTVLQGIGDSETSVMSQKAITDAIASLTALPHGGSKEWLENNGDKTQLYQINGYIWAYIESTGWTQSGTQFIVVSSESQMTNVGGTPYVLRSGDNGTVYNYHEASGDFDTPLHSTLPTTASEGDIVAVGDKKYQASLSTVTVEHNAYDPDTAQFNKRIASSDGSLRDLNGALLLDYTEVEYNPNCIVTIKGMANNLQENYSSYFIVDFYDKDKNRLGYVAGGAFFLPHTSAGVGDNGTLPLSFRLFAYNNKLDTTNVGYVRIKLGIKPDGTSISASDVEGLVVNFSTKNETKTEVKWTEVGTYEPPVEAGWDATEETYSVIDSLSVTANNGESSVYSVDGYVYSYIAGSAWVQTSKYDNPMDSILVDGKSAYKYAKEGGYNGTESEFAKDINPDNIKAELTQIEVPTIVSSISEMTDTTKHYVLDGYIHQYGTQGWVNSGLSYQPTFKTDLIGVMGEDNVIYLSDNLPSGTYTLKYPDNNYAIVGTIIK